MDKGYKGKTEAELLKQFQETDDLEALGVLYQKYTAQIFGVCLKYFKNVTDAEDASMELFGLLIKRLKGKEIDNFGAWLYTVTKNHCIEKLRTTQRKRIQKESADFVYSAEVYHPDTENNNLDQERRLKECIDKLKVAQRDCVQLFYFEKMNYDEIASKMQIEWNQVRSNIQNGRRNLRNCLEK